MTNDTIKVIQERLEMLRDNDLINAGEYRALRLLVEEVEQQYMKLPLDADGVPIRIGDVIIDPYCKDDKPVTVSAIGKDDVFAFGEGGGGFHFVAVAHHYKPVTVEMLLEQFACEVIDAHERGQDVGHAFLEVYARQIKGLKE